jgi:hypothetical protein
MTTAALEALSLRRLLGGPEAGDLERRYFRVTGKLVAEAWETSAASDLRFPEVEGKRRPGAALINAYGEKYRAAASVDPVLGQTFLRVANMIDRPAKLLSPGARGAGLPLGRPGCPGWRLISARPPEPVS